MITRADYDRLARGGYNRIPLHRQVLADLETPVSAYLKMAQGPYSYLFESVQGGEKWGRYSIIGLPCSTVVRIKADLLLIEQDGQEIHRQHTDDPLESIQKIHRQFNVPELDSMPRFNGGLVGYFGYNSVRYIEPHLGGQDLPDPVGAPDILLMRVSGLNATLVENIVAYRNQNGLFPNRKALNKVPRFGAKTYRLAAGFLRIQNGGTPLDCSAVHPESYPLVERILKKTGLTLSQLMANKAVLHTLQVADFVDSHFGAPTVQDIFAELEKPGRDPRPAFQTATFQEGVEDIKDLQPGMILEGTVSNVTNFGAFVDVGVHQDGLVHISAMADRFVKNPHEITHAGALVKVRVVEIDLKRRRIALRELPKNKTPPCLGCCVQTASPRRPCLAEPSHQATLKECPIFC